MKSILSQIEHRPFPLPDAPWVMRQSWRNLLFAHWPVAASALRDALPSCLEIDTFEGSAWVAVVPFSMNEVCPRFVSPMPWISDFLELNVRTYVSHNGIRGVFFFSLDCSNPLAVRVARSFFHLPYYDAEMSLEASGSEIRYHSVRHATAEEFKVNYAPVGGLLQTSADSIEHFLTERYCLYTTDSAGKLKQGVIHHLPWPLQKAEAEIFRNTMISSRLGFSLPDTEPLLHFSKSIDTVEWMLR